MSMDIPSQTIDKIDAAVRQLKLAIRLFFRREDPIPIYTLTGAAHGILYDMAKAKGIKSVFINSELIRPEKREYVNKIFRNPQNFFKHADKDPENTIKFFPHIVPFYLLDAVLIYNQLTGVQFPELTTLYGWFSIKFPDILDEGKMKDLFTEEVISTLELRYDLDPYDFEMFSEAIDALYRANS